MVLLMYMNLQIEIFLKSSVITQKIKDDPSEIVKNHFSSKFLFPSNKLLETTF